MWDGMGWDGERESRAKTPRRSQHTPEVIETPRSSPPPPRNAPHHHHCGPLNSARSCPPSPSTWLPRQARHARLGTRAGRKCWAGCWQSRGINHAYRNNYLQHIPHTTTMKAPSTALLRTFSPLWRSDAPLATARGCMAQQQQQRADFSSTPANQARDKRNKQDPRISMAT